MIEFDFQQEKNFPYENRLQKKKTQRYSFTLKIYKYAMLIMR